MSPTRVAVHVLPRIAVDASGAGPGSTLELAVDLVQELKLDAVREHRRIKGVAADAIAAGATFVTVDRAFTRFPAPDLHLIE